MLACFQAYLNLESFAMASWVINGAWTLESLKARLAALQTEAAKVEAAIAALEALQDSSVDAPTEAGDEGATYAGMTFYEAVGQLTKSNGPKTAREIADELKANGFVTNSKNFANTAGTLLRRLREDGYAKVKHGKWTVG